MKNPPKGLARILILWLAGEAMIFAAQSRQGRAFYQPARERRLVGVIHGIKREPRSSATSPFLQVQVKDSGTGELYTAELCPVWFCRMALEEGKTILITGAMVYRENQERTLLAREIHYQGGVFRLRDKNGFPLWRGGRWKNRWGR